MTLLTLFKNKIDNRLAYNMLIGFALGLLFPLTGWIIEFIVNSIPVNLAGFAQLHKQAPVLFIIDFIPVIIAIIIYYLAIVRKREQEYYEKQLLTLDEKINKNAEFAKRIGQGDYEASYEDIDSDDILGKSLILMRNNLLENYKKEAEQNWISEGKDIISNILRMHNKIDDLSYDVLVNLIKYINVIQGALYIYDEEEDLLQNVSTYAYNRQKFIRQSFRIGQGLIGQCAYEMDIIYRTEIPKDFITITSGILGDRKPSCILMVPLIADEKLQGVLEFASLEEIQDRTIKYVKELGEIIARTLFNLKVNHRTEKLLKEAQEMTRELQENEEQLRQNAEEMRATQEELEKSNTQLEAQILAVENAQKRLHSLLENASEIISIYDKDLKMVYVSPSVTKILGFTQDEMMRGKDMERLTRKGEMELRKMLDSLLENPTETISIQYTYIKKDGSKIFLETTGRNLLHDQAIHGIILNSQDITTRKKAEKEERLRSRMQSLSENSLDMIIRLNTQGQFFYANPVVESYLGVTPDEIMSKKLKELNISEVFKDYLSDIIGEMKSSPNKSNKQITLVNGEERIMSIDAIPEFSENENELETILVVGHDITEAKRIELEIQEKNRKIEDSINYAQRIQTSILPNNQTIREVFPKSFIYYKPRDVVSGDFPWFFQKGENVYIAAVDCTGHGVPGALLSFIAYFILNNVVDHDDNMNAGKICDEVHYKVRSTLNQDKPDAKQRDGMDIAFCKYNHKKKELQYAGAHRPLYLLRHGKLQEYKGTRKAIGGIPLLKRSEPSFITHTISIKDGDKIFFFSDGITDQIGGPENKKYSPKRIRDIIESNPDFNITKFNNLFAKDFKEWTGENKQIDDVLLIGIEF